jgi:hypothetical protein
MFKITLTFVLFVFANLGNASTIKDFDSDALQLLTASSHCPAEFVEAMEGADRVGRAKYIDDRRRGRYTITTVRQEEGPNYETRDVATLKITRTRVRSKGKASNQRASWSIDCDIIRYD